MKHALLAQGTVDISDLLEKDNGQGVFREQLFLILYSSCHSIPVSLERKEYPREA